MYESKASSQPSFRRRRTSTTSEGTPPRRCSSAVSVASADSVSHPSSIRTDDADVHAVKIQESAPWLLSKTLAFDPLNLVSSSRRRERMVASVEATTKSDASSRVSNVPHFGVEVCFIPDKFHYAATELEPYRTIGDPEMDALLQHLSERRDDDDDDASGRCGCGPFDDVISHAAKEYEMNDSSRQQSPSVQFYKHYTEDVPDWVDFDRIQRGVDVFLAYLPAAGCALFYRSLVGGFSIPRIVEVLTATRYLVPTSGTTTTTTSDDGPFESARPTDRDRARSMERLVDTGGFLACCFAPPSSFSAVDSDTGEVAATSAQSLRPGGAGWEAALRVRALHAKVRRSLLLRSPRWDVEKNGVPINQEDMAATLLAFSVNVLLGIEIVAGRPLPQGEQRDYLALWRYIGWLLGVDTPETEGAEGPFRSSNADGRNPLVPIDPCGPRKTINLDDRRQTCTGSDSKHAHVDASDDPIVHSHATLESMIIHLLHPEEKSRDLVSHLLRIRPHSHLFRSELCRKFLGDPLSDKLGIPTSSANWKGWGRPESVVNLVQHIGVKFTLYSFLLFLRCYTLLVMTFPRVRSCAVAWHGLLEGKFLRGWKKANSRRVTKAAAAVGRRESAAPQWTSPQCPFSMVMVPGSAG